jgi:excisionase family DNA binding protein
MLQSDKLAVNRAEAARLLSVSLRTLDGLMARKEISFRRIGRRVVFAVVELERFLQKDHPSGQRVTQKSATTRATA